MEAMRIYWIVIGQSTICNVKMSCLRTWKRLRKSLFQWSWTALPRLS